MAKEIITTFQLKRGTASRWYEVNPILKQGEPGYVIDGNQLKIGDGKTPWRELPFIGNDSIMSVKTYEELPETGNSNFIYRVSNDKKLYQWNETESKYEPLSGGTVGDFDPSSIKIINGGNANE